MLYRRHGRARQVVNKSTTNTSAGDGRVGVASGRITAMRYATMAQEVRRMHCFCCRRWADLTMSPLLTISLLHRQTSFLCAQICVAACLSLTRSLLPHVPRRAILLITHQYSSAENPLSSSQSVPARVPVKSLTRVRACHRHSMRDSQRRPQISGMFYHMRLPPSGGLLMRCRPPQRLLCCCVRVMDAAWLFGQDNR